MVGHCLYDATVPADCIHPAMPGRLPSTPSRHSRVREAWLLLQALSAYFNANK